MQTASKQEKHVKTNIVYLQQTKIRESTLKGICAALLEYDLQYHSNIFKINITIQQHLFGKSKSLIVKIE
ncbi:MAG: hypothetical protein M3R72_12545 [Bacteroidota bacterium]|nr:hypothetical protein [Bacteroidota bacterium]